MLRNRSQGRLTRSQTRRNINNDTVEDTDSDNTPDDMGAVASRASGPITDPEQNENTQRDAENATDDRGIGASPIAEPAAIEPPREEDVLVVQRSDESDDGSDVEFLMETESDESSGSHMIRRGIVSRSVASLPSSSSNLPGSSTQSSPMQMSRVAQRLSRRVVVEVDLENQRNEENDVQVVSVSPISIQLDSDSDNEVEVVWNIIFLNNILTLIDYAFNTKK